MLSVLLNKAAQLSYDSVKTKGTWAAALLPFVHHLWRLEGTAAISPGLTGLPFVPGYFLQQMEAGLGHLLCLQASVWCQLHVQGQRGDGVAPAPGLTGRFLLSTFLFKQCLSRCLTNIGK